MGTSRKVEFVNELGNNIRISLFIHDPKMSHSEYTISMHGPTSSHTNTITYKELKELQKLINDNIKEKQ